MTLVERIDNDVKEAMKAKKTEEVSTLRMAKAALKNKEIETGTALGDDAAQVVVKTLVKQYKDALNDFKTAGRTDLAEKQEAEIRLLEAYLPAQMPMEEVEKIVAKVLEGMPGATGKDMGKIMGAVMKEIAGRADGTVVKEALQKKLSA